MAIDYVSTAPWNNPLNTFTKYSELTLSGNCLDDNGDPVFADNVTVGLIGFFPLSATEDYTWLTYHDGGDWYVTAATVGGSDVQFVIEYNGGGGVQFVKSVSFPSFEIPFKTTDTDADGWSPNVGYGPEGLLLLPKTKAGWEKRRIAGGTG